MISHVGSHRVHDMHLGLISHSKLPMVCVVVCLFMSAFCDELAVAAKHVTQTQ